MQQTKVGIKAEELIRKKVIEKDRKSIDCFVKIPKLVELNYTARLNENV